MLSRTQIVSILILSMFTSSCFLKPKKKSGGNGSGKTTFHVIQEPVTMTRIGDGTRANLGFKTSEKVFCELAHYSQEDGGTPTKEDPVVTECPNDKSRDDFLVRIDGLETDTLYWVILTVYKDKDSKQPSERVLIPEPSGSNTDPDDPTPSVGTYDSLLVARMNVPLKTAEVHRHVFAGEQSISDIKSESKRETGCKLGIPTPDGAFRQPSNSIGIENLATTSFASDKSATHPEFSGIKRLEYSGLNIGLDQWKFIYSQDSSDIEVKARSGNTLQSIEISSTEKALLPEPQLAVSVDPLAIDDTKPLVVSWETDANLLSSSYLLVYIGRPSDDTSIYCAFPAKDKRGEVDAKLLAGLPEDRHVILATLESNQFLATDGWYISTYDWRSGRIEKL